MGTVKYSGPVASFHCPTNAEIRSLKVHFSPKQEGTGDPSPDNVRPIVGWDGVKITHSKKNLFNGIIKVGRDTIGDGTLDNSNTWRTSEPILIKSNTSYTIMNGSVLLKPYINVYDNNMNRLRTYTNSSIILTLENAKYITLQMTQSTFESILKDVAVYETDENIKINYEFGVLGKNKLPITADMEIKSVNTGYNNTLQRDMTSGILYPNVSANNYWLGTSAKTFVQEVQNGSITFQANDGSYGIGTIVPVQPQATYTISYTTSDNQVRMRIGCYDADGYFTGTHQIINNGASFTIPNDVYYMIIVATPNTDYYNQSITVSNLQLELGSTATAYEPYDPKHTVYGGWVDLISGEVCEEWGSKILNGTENWSTQAPHGNFARIFLCNPTNSTMIGNSTASKPNGMTDIFDVVKQNGDESSGGRLCCRFGWGDKNFYILNAVENIPEVTDTASLKEYLSEHNIHIVYNLQTQYYNTYHLAPTTLQTFLGHNNVWSNADYVEVEYDLHETQSLLQRKAFIMANQPHVVKPAAATLQNFKTDVIAPLKECKVHFGPVQDLHGYSNPWPAGGGKNLFNAATSTPKKYVGSDGNIYISDDWSVSDYIAVAPSETYTISGADAPGGTGCHAFYDSNKDFVSAVTGYDHMTFTVPEEATYVRFSVRTETPTTVQLEKGSTATSYAPYENVCPISGWTGLRVYHSGKNILPITDTRVQNQQQIDFPGGVLSFSSKTSIEGRSPQFVVNDKDGTQVRYWTLTGTENNITYRDNINTQNIPKYRVNGGAYDVQAELGKTHTEYESFKGSVNTIDWTTEAGTVYGGYVDLVNGEVVQTYDRILADDSVTWYWDEQGSAYNRVYIQPTAYGGHYGKNKGKMYFSYARNSGNNGVWYGWLSSTGTNPHILMFIPEEIHSKNAWKDYLAEHPLEIIYELETPIVYQLAPTQLKTLRGTNNIWSNANGNIELAYWSH